MSPRSLTLTQYMHHNLSVYRIWCIILLYNTPKVTARFQIDTKYQPPLVFPVPLLYVSTNYEYSDAPQ